MTDAQKARSHREQKLLCAGLLPRAAWGELP